MTLPDVVLGAACLALVVLWVHSELSAQRLRSDLAAGTTNATRASEALEQARQALMQASEALTESDSERQAALAEAASLRQRLGGVDERRAQLALLTDDERAALLAARCGFCGGMHPRYALPTFTASDQRACPRVRRLRMGQSGNVVEAEFRESWDQSEVLWPDEIAAVGAEAEAAKRTEQHKERPLKVISG